MIVIDGGFAAVTEANSYTSNFSVGADGWTPQRGTVVGNIDTDADAAGQPPSDNWLRFTTNNVDSSHYATKTTGVMTVGNCYRGRVDYYIPSGQSNIDGIKIRLGGVYSDIVNNTTGALASIDFYAIAVADVIQIWGYDGTANSWQDAGTDDVFYLRNVRVEAVTLTNWTEGTGWAPQAAAGALTGKANKVAGTASDLTQSGTPAQAGNNYDVNHTIVRTAGTLTPEFGSVDGAIVNSSGAYSDDITALDTDFLKFKANSAFAGSVELASITVDNIFGSGSYFGRNIARIGSGL